MHLFISIQCFTKLSSGLTEICDFITDVIVPNLVNTLFGSVTVLHNVLNVEVQTTKKHI